MQSKGEYRVGTTFNPSASDTVSRIKRLGAELIDLIEEIPSADHPEAGEVWRAKSLAQTEVESAVHWAVKAATKPRERG